MDFKNLSTQEQETMITRSAHALFMFVRHHGLQLNLEDLDDMARAVLMTANGPDPDQDPTQYQAVRDIAQDIIDDASKANEALHQQWQAEVKATQDKHQQLVQDKQRQEEQLAHSVGGLLSEEQLAKRYFGDRISDSGGITIGFDQRLIPLLAAEKTVEELARMLPRFQTKQQEQLLALLTDEQLIELDKIICDLVQSGDDDLFYNKKLRQAITADGVRRVSAR